MQSLPTVSSSRFGAGLESVRLGLRSIRDVAVKCWDDRVARGTGLTPDQGGAVVLFNPLVLEYISRPPPSTPPRG